MFACAPRQTAVVSALNLCPWVFKHIVRHFCLPLVFLSLLSGSALADHNQHKTITWYAYHQPPAAIVEGPQKGKGYVDKMLTLLTDNLPGYRHVVLPASLGRVTYDLKAGKNVCFAAMMVTKERLNYVHFSQRSMLTPNNRVTMKKSLAKKLGLTDEVALSWLKQQPDLLLGMVDGRSYGTKLDNLLQQDSSNVVSRPDDSNLGLYHMLEKDRIDYVINYPHEASEAFKTLDSTTDYTTLKVTELEDFVYGSVGCPKTDWGKKVIDDINVVLTRLKQSPRYYRALSEWLPQDIRKQGFETAYRQDFINN